MPVRHVNSVNQFEQLISNHNSETFPFKVTIVDFTAGWCIPCQRIAPLFDQYSNEFKNVLFIKIDADQNTRIKKFAKVRAYPTFNVYQNGNLIDQMVGSDENVLRSLIQRHS